MAENKTLMLVETQQETQVRILEENLREVAQALDVTMFQFQERLAGLDRMAEDIGWTDISGFGNDDGPDLAQLHKRSKQIRSALALNPHIKRGAALRVSYTWGDPISYTNVPGLEGAPGKGNANVGALVKSPINQHYIFGSTAREERERALFTDGGYFLLGDDATKTAFPVPLAEINALYRNPDNQAEVWAYRRSWSRWNADTATDEPVVRWYFTDLSKDKRVEQIRFNSKVEAVDNTKTLIDGFVNRQIGWALGFPDAGAVIEWVRLYNKFIRSGLDMNSAMASIWAIAKNATAAGTSNAAAKIAGMTGSGNTAVGNTELAPLATAGKTYDFSSGTTILAIVAAGLEVSVVALSASPADSGSSYGAAATLDLPARLATERRRDWHCAYDQRILRWMGAKDPIASFPPLVDSEEQYRATQVAALRWNSGLYNPEDAKKGYEAANGNQGVAGPVPDGVLIPNNTASEERTDIDPNGAAYAGPDSNSTGTQAANPEQGQSTGTGKSPKQGTKARNISK